MVETLVAMVIMAVGVMGAAGLQLTALRTARQTAFATIASHLAADMADAIRASQGWASRNGSVDPYLDASLDSGDAEGSTPPARSCYSDTCDPTEFAAFEVSEWKARIRSTLPAGRFRICRDIDPWDGSRNAPAWQCHDNAADTAPIVVKLGWRINNPDASLASHATGHEEAGMTLIVGAGV
ncbi:hypothetical protein GCM10027343_30480 [Noviherbaspirillum agri]